MALNDELTSFDVVIDDHAILSQHPGEISWGVVNGYHHWLKYDEFFMPRTQVLKNGEILKGRVTDLLKPQEHAYIFFCAPIDLEAGSTLSGEIVFEDDLLNIHLFFNSLEECQEINPAFQGNHLEQGQRLATFVKCMKEIPDVGQRFLYHGESEQEHFDISEMPIMPRNLVTGSRLGVVPSSDPEAP